MARQIKAYGCDFKCGTKVLMSKKAMEAHEVICFYNPERKACVSCANFETFEDSNGMEHEPQNLQTWRHTECLASEDFDISEKLRHDCESYVNKIESPELIG